MSGGARKRVVLQHVLRPASTQAPREALFVVGFRMCGSQEVLDATRMILQRGRSCSELLGVSIGCESWSQES